jgi:predicted DNA-binding transcriptional regulator AlpA
MERLLDTKALETQSGISARTWERKRGDGSGPKFVRIGRRVLYPVSAVSAFLAERTHASTAAADQAARERARCHARDVKRGR